MAGEPRDHGLDSDVEFRREMEAAFLAAGLRTGRMVGDSTPAYLRDHPGHAVVFNATVCDEGGRALWSGDLDLTLDAERLADVAAALGRSLYVLFERDTWPETRFLRAVMVVSPRSPAGATDEVSEGEHRHD